MKKNDIYEEIGNVSPDLISEADPTAPIVTRKTKILRALSAFAACIAVLIISSSLWLFLPYSTEIPEALGALSESEYYDIWKELYLFGESQKDRPKNNYEKHLQPRIYEYFKTLHKDEQNHSNYAGEYMSDSVAGSITSPYVEVTDNQFKEVIEPDRIKRTEKHIFYLAEDMVYCYSIDGDNSECCGTYDGFKDRNGKYGEYLAYEFFLSEDGSELIVMGSRKGLIVVVLDVSDPKNMKEKAVIQTDAANYISSRISRGKLILAYKSKTSFDTWENPESMLPPSVYVYGPQVSSDIVEFHREDIVLPEKIVSSSYLVFLQIDLAEFKVEEKLAVLSETNVLTISEDYIITRYERTESEKKIIDTYPSAISRTHARLSVISYGNDGFGYVGSYDFDGAVVSRYAVDVADNVLRVVTTSGETVFNRITLERTVEDVSCDLWVYDLKKGRMIASVENFAPADEDVKSVRFDGDIAYICTAKAVGGIYSDPVYYFDLSNYKNITSIDTGEIDGYSETLKPFGEGILLGIGRTQDSKGNNSTLKVEIYADKGDRVEPICSYEREFVAFARSYHSYLFDVGKGYVGIALTDWTRKDNSGYYLLLHFDGEKLVPLLEEEFEGQKSRQEYSRSVLIDGYLYIMYYGDFRVIKVD